MNACKRSQQSLRFRTHSIRFARHLPSRLVRWSATPTRQSRTSRTTHRKASCTHTGWCGEPWIQSCQRREEGVNRPDREGVGGAREEGDPGAKSGRRGGEGQETKGEEQVEKAVVEDVHMEYHPSVAPVLVSEAPGASALEGEYVESSQPQAELLLGPKANPNFLQRFTTDWTTETGSASDSIDICRRSARLAVRRRPGNAQDDGKRTLDCPQIDPTLDNVLGCTSGVSLLPQKEGLDRSFEMREVSAPTAYAAS